MRAADLNIGAVPGETKVVVDFNGMEVDVSEVRTGACGRIILVVDDADYTLAFGLLLGDVMSRRDGDR